jgi:hypothetical protein
MKERKSDSFYFVLAPLFRIPGKGVHPLIYIYYYKTKKKKKKKKKKKSRGTDL